MWRRDMKDGHTGLVEPLLDDDSAKSQPGGVDVRRVVSMGVGMTMSMAMSLCSKFCGLARVEEEVGV